MFKKTLASCGWQYIFIGEGEKLEGFTTRIRAYYIVLLGLSTEKVVVLSDARDVFCTRSTLTFIEHVKEWIDDQIIVISEMFLIGHMEWTDSQIERVLQKNPIFLARH